MKKESRFCPDEQQHDPTTAEKHDPVPKFSSSNFAIPCVRLNHSPGIGTTKSVWRVRLLLQHTVNKFKQSFCAGIIGQAEAVVDFGMAGVFAAIKSDGNLGILQD